MKKTEYKWCHIVWKTIEGKKVVYVNGKKLKEDCVGQYVQLGLDKGAIWLKLPISETLSANKIPIRFQQ